MSEKRSAAFWRHEFERLAIRGGEPVFDAIAKRFDDILRAPEERRKAA